MANAFPQGKSVTDRIFDNIIFLGDIFGNREEWEIPDVPVLELARSFELKRPREAAG